MPNLQKYENLLEAVKKLIKAEKDSIKRSEKVRDLEPNANRSKANARWGTAAEYRDRMKHLAHCRAVEADIAERYDESCYGEIKTNDAWYPKKINRPHPLGISE